MTGFPFLRTHVVSTSASPTRLLSLRLVTRHAPWFVANGNRLVRNFSTWNKPTYTSRFVPIDRTVSSHPTRLALLSFAPRRIAVLVAHVQARTASARPASKGMTHRRATAVPPPGRAIAAAAWRSTPCSHLLPRPHSLPVEEAVDGARAALRCADAMHVRPRVYVRVKFVGRPSKGSHQQQGISAGEKKTPPREATWQHDQPAGRRRRSSGVQGGGKAIHSTTFMVPMRWRARVFLCRSHRSRSRSMYKAW